MTREPGGEPEDAEREEERIQREVCRLAHRFTQRLDTHVRRVAEEFGLTASQVVALRELSEPITARTLAGRMLCEPSNATFVLDRLEGQGLIERRPHPTDRRAKQIALTPEGLRCRERVLARMSERSPLAPLASAQREQLCELLGALVEDS
ncbi:MULTISPECIES: MarR family transcriptional regulator [unclassified Streptomyces]|uniref:MarR family winged helix-turn-helix transcriptional regulator n=1 Tax=unclassified Streptomyces TaxID=2593676 RepID=UPI002DDA0B74|nr:MULTISPECIES: MarR family transcriptional regulator [unclassified Streptomyces]WSA95527.1 MarR family transcriptional regulator [Streptomyces sp. NBC_01795]WSB79941.1 MarR family transcriptional regulator [Streptomyces sp. NBC_01775]WSS11851.1 MarR family transcriptional regulator [Streptomyces sp. NBC_01186]WSS40566.1 MarR family transcriptional regulator [Streptomyces sp. NBC_01187]